MEGSPSAKSGLSAGDEILAINNIPLAQLVPEQLVQLLSQARQQAAVLDVRKPGNARAFRLTLSPELIDAPSVDRAFLLRPGSAICASRVSTSPPASWSRAPSKSWAGKS